MEELKFVTAFGIKITERDAARYIEAKSAAGSTCPACGEQSRVVLLTGVESETACIVPTAKTVEGEDGKLKLQAVTGSRFIPVWHLWCNECGFLQAFTLGTLAKWVRNNPEETSAGESNEQAE